MNTFEAMELPPQQPSIVYVCRGCAAIVVNRTTHADACRGAQNVLAATAEAAAPAVVEVQTGDGQTVGTLESPPDTAWAQTEDVRQPRARRSAADVLGGT